MAVKIRRTYKGGAVSAVTAAEITTAAATSITLSSSPTTWPTGKFFVVVAPGTSKEEKMCVTLSGSTLTVVDPAVTSTSASANGRGVDNTTAQSGIPSGSTVYPVFTAVDADEANELTSTYSAQGHIVYQGASTFAGLGIGTAGQVLKVNSGATAPEWGQVATAGITDSAVTTAKINDDAVTTAKIANDAVTTGKIAAGAVGTTDIADDAVTMDKLAPAATPALVHINTTTMSAESSKVVSNVFTSTYRSYRIVISGITPSGGFPVFAMRMAASGSENSESKYSMTKHGMFSSNQTSQNTSTLNQTFWGFGDPLDTSSIVIDLDCPQVASRKTTGVYHSNYNYSGDLCTFQGGLLHNSTTQFDGFKVYGISTGNFTCTISVYGYTI